MSVEQRSAIAGNLVRLLAVFQRWLYLPNTDPVLATLGALAANLISGDPVWLLLVAPSSTLKTELLQSTHLVPKVHSVTSITEAGLLSGTEARDRDPNATGGLLRQVGEHGIIVIKDFTSILSMRREARSVMLAAFRDIYDGTYRRALGTGGGSVLPWHGKAGLLGGVTQVIDTHHSAMATMGERFVLFRMPEADEDAQADAALSHAATGERMRTELAEAVRDFFARLGLEGREITTREEDRTFLKALATWLARCRSSVIRDGSRRDIELIPGVEGPGRIVIVLDRLLAGLRVIGASDSAARRLVERVAWDCIPTIRRQILETMIGNATVLPSSSVAPHSVDTIAKALGYSVTTTWRHLEEMEAHRVVARERQGPSVADGWFPSEWCRSKLEAIRASTAPKPDTTQALSVPSTNSGNDPITTPAVVHETGLFPNCPPGLQGLPARDFRRVR